MIFERTFMPNVDINEFEGRLHNFEDGYEPFDPFTEMVMGKYLDEKPSFLREKKEE